MPLFFFFLSCDERTKPDSFQHFPSFSLFFSPLILFPFLAVENQMLSEVTGQFETAAFAMLLWWRWCSLFRLSAVSGYSVGFSFSFWLGPWLTMATLSSFPVVPLGRQGCKHHTSKERKLTEGQLNEENASIGYFLVKTKVPFGL